MKLIHSGKVLKDDAIIEGCGIKPNDFLVVMVTKAKKAAAAPAPAPTPAAPKTPAPAAAAAPADGATAMDATTTPAASSSTDTPAAPARPSAADEFPDEIVTNLTGMGFPEAEVRHCLRAANGNPDIAMEFLTNGIPPGVEAAAAAGASSPAAGGGAGGLEGLRNHPQFNQLRRLVQTNPQMLQTVLTQIGQQQPELLAEINSNQAAFLAMMNEPIEEPAPGAAGTGASSSSSAGGGGAGLGAAAGMLEGMANPAQMAQMIQSMSPNELNQMAQMMGLSADQLRQTAQMLGQIPPDQLQQYMRQAMGGGGGGMGDMAGLMGAAGGGGGGPQVLRLNEEEMAAVDRLTEMGFDRAEAAQAFLACDKNEALAANLLMDGGFGFGGDDGGAGGGGGGGDGGGGGTDNNDDDAMYD